MKDGQKIVFHGEGDQEPGLESGDIIIVLDQREHPLFTRSENILPSPVPISCGGSTSPALTKTKHASSRRSVREGWDVSL